jgi:uracil-DNA glycosylase
VSSSADVEAVIGTIPPAWAQAIGSAASPERLAPIAEFVAARAKRVLPDRDRVFAALEATPPNKVRAVILGQDPYPNAKHAVGLAFSVPEGVDGPLPPSLRRIRAELQLDRSLALPAHGSLEAWTRHGVLLLNTTLTVDEGVSGSHWQARWWTLTDAIIEAVVSQGRPIAFLLWGKHAQTKTHLITGLSSFAVPSPHPMARSKVGFARSHPFSRADAGLRERCTEPIDWSLADNL